MSRLRDLVHRDPRYRVHLPAWLERLVSVGIVSTDPQIVRRQRCVNVAAFAMVATTAAHLIINSLHDFRGLLPINADNLVMLVGALMVPRLHRFGEHVSAITLLVLMLLGHTFIVWSFGLASELQVYFTLAGAMVFFFGVPNWRLFLAFYLAFVVALVVALNFAPPAGLVMPDDKDFRGLLSNQAMITMIMINAALMFYALATRHRAEIELQDEHDRSEALIATVMPSTIAERLKSGDEDRIADRIDMLSVMFADLVGVYPGGARPCAGGGRRLSGRARAQLRHAERTARGREDQDHRGLLHGRGRLRRRRRKGRCCNRPHGSGHDRGH